MRILRADTDGTALSGELADGDSGRFEGALDCLKSSDAGVPVVDLMDVGEISSKCIGLLVAAWADCTRRSRWFELRASDEVWTQLNEVGAARIFFERPDGVPRAAPPTFIRTERKGTDTDLTSASPATDSRGTERSSVSLTAEIERYVERLAELELRATEAEVSAETITAERNDYAIRLRAKEAELEDVRAGLEGRIVQVRVEESATRREYGRLSAREAELVFNLTELGEQLAVVERERDAIAAQLKGERSRPKPGAAARAGPPAPPKPLQRGEGPKKAVGKPIGDKAAKKTPKRHKGKARKSPSKKGKPSGKRAKAAKKKTVTKRVKKAKRTGGRRKGPVRAK